MLSYVHVSRFCRWQWIVLIGSLVWMLVFFLFVFNPLVARLDDDYMDPQQAIIIGQSDIARTCFIHIPSLEKVCTLSTRNIRCAHGQPINGYMNKKGLCQAQLSQSHFVFLMIVFCVWVFFPYYALFHVHQKFQNEFCHRHQHHRLTFAQFQEMWCSPWRVMKDVFRCSSEPSFVVVDDEEEE
jgi:hypothetical protein